MKFQVLWEAAADAASARDEILNQKRKAVTLVML